MENMRYYVVEVAFNSNNSIHRSIAYHHSNGHLELFGAYEGVINKRIKELAYFQVIEEIPSVTAAFPNQWTTPNELKRKTKEKTR